MCIVCGVLTRGGDLRVGHLGFAGVNALFLVLVAASILATRKTMLGNALNRRLSAISAMLFAGYVCLWPLLGAVGVTLVDSTLVHNLMGALVWGAAAIAVERRWLILAAAQFVSFGLVTQWQQYHYEILGVVVALGSVAIAARSNREVAVTDPTPG